MAKDWSAEKSPTARAAENNHRNLALQQKDALVAHLHRDIETLDDVLANLDTVSVGSTDADLITAVRSLGAYQALLRRKLSAETRDQQA